MTGGISVEHVLVIALSFEIVLLATTGLLHIVRPAHLEQAAARHRTAGAIPNWLGALERSALVGAVEVAVAGAIAVSVASGREALVIVVHLLVAGFASSLLSFVSILRRSPASLPCGCHPFTGDVTSATFVPAAALLCAAVAVVSILRFAERTALSTSGATATAAMGALAAGVALLYAGAATSKPSSRRSEV